MIQREGGNLRSSLLFSLCVAIWNADPRGILSLPPSLSSFLLSNRNDIRQRGGISGGDGIQQRQNRGKTVFVSFSRTRFKLGGFRRRVSSGSANSEKKRTHLLFARPGCSSLALSLHVGGIYLMMELPESCLKPLTRRGGEEKFLSFPSPLLPINNPSKVRRRRRRRRPPFLSSHPSLKFPQTERKEENALLLLYRT